MNTTSEPKPGSANATNAQTAMNGVLPVTDLLKVLRDYAREKPDVAALWCFGIGFVLGWRLKPW